MGPLATLIAGACLEALRWLLWATAGLLVLLIVVQWARGDAGARPEAVALLGLGFVVAGFVCGRAADWFRRRS
jgi:hypothetical protein